MNSKNKIKTTREIISNVTGKSRTAIEITEIISDLEVAITFKNFIRKYQTVIRTLFSSPSDGIATLQSIIKFQDLEFKKRLVIFGCPKSQSVSQIFKQRSRVNAIAPQSSYIVNKMYS